MLKLIWVKLDIVPHKGYLNVNLSLPGTPSNCAGNIEWLGSLGQSCMASYLRIYGSGSVPWNNKIYIIFPALGKIAAVITMYAKTSFCGQLLFVICCSIWGCFCSICCDVLKVEYLLQAVKVDLICMDVIVILSVISFSWPPLNVILLPWLCGFQWCNEVVSKQQLCCCNGCCHFFTCNKISFI